MPYTPAGIPAYLKALNRWALSAPHQTNFYGREFSEKAPILPVHGKDYVRGIKPNDESTWATFDEVDAWQDLVGGYPGIMVAAPYVGIDFDLEKGSAEYRHWVETECLPRCPGYVERSPSGNGYRIIIEGSIPVSRRTKVLEVYSCSRFLRMTGEALPAPTMPMDAQAWIDWIYPTGGEPVDAESIQVDVIPAEEARAAYEWALENVRFNDRAVIEMADNRTTEGSDACFAVCVALAKADIDPSTAFTILLSLEGVQDYYQERYAQDGGRQLHRKFTEYWWPEANAKAPMALDKDASEDKLAAEMQKADEDARVATQKAPRPKAPTDIPVPDRWLLNEALACYDKSVSRRIQELQWNRISALLFAGLITSACYRTASSACPAMLVSGASSTGKENPPKFVKSILQEAEGGGINQPFFDVGQSISSGEAIRDNVRDDAMMVWLQSEVGPLLAEVGQNTPRGQSMQEYFPDAICGNTIAKNFRANVSKDKQAFTTVNPRMSVYWGAQPHWLPAFYTRYTLEGGIAGRLINMPAQERPRHLAPEYVLPLLQGQETLVKAARVCAMRARSQNITWTRIEDQDGLAQRLHDEFPHLGAMEAIHGRLGELIGKWACIFYACRDIQNHIGGQGAKTEGWVSLPAEDIDAAFALVKMSVGVLRSISDWGEAGDVNLQYYLTYVGIQRAVAEVVKRNGKTVGITRIHQYVPQYLRAGRPNGGDQKFERDRSLIVKVCDELVFQGVLGTTGKAKGGYVVLEHTEERIAARVAEVAPAGI